MAHIPIYTGLWFKAKRLDVTSAIDPCDPSGFPPRNSGCSDATDWGNAVASDLAASEPSRHGIQWQALKIQSDSDVGMFGDSVLKNPMVDHDFAQ